MTQGLNLQQQIQQLSQQSAQDFYAQSINLSALISILTSAID